MGYYEYVVDVTAIDGGFKGWLGLEDVIFKIAHIEVSKSDAQG